MQSGHFSALRRGVTRLHIRFAAFVHYAFLSSPATLGSPSPIVALSPLSAAVRASMSYFTSSFFGYGSSGTAAAGSSASSRDVPEPVAAGLDGHMADPQSRDASNTESGSAVGSEQGPPQGGAGGEVGGPGRNEHHTGLSVPCDGLRQRDEGAHQSSTALRPCLTRPSCADSHWFPRGHDCLSGLPDHRPCIPCLPVCLSV